MFILARETITAAQDHARREYPKESCGLVVGDTYIPCFNYASIPERDFSISPADYLRAGKVRAIIHSHPNGPHFPTARDMQSQITSAVVWGIIVTDGERASEPILWGDQLPTADLIGREFVHGIADCYSVVRDAYAAGRERMSAQTMSDWPLDPIALPDVPRDDSWWHETDEHKAQDLYTDHFAKFGFVKIAQSEARPGDAFLMAIKSKTLNHAGVLVSRDLILHHLPQRLSRREPAGSWARHANLWVRYEGQK